MIAHSVNRIIEVSDLTHEYDGRKALNGVSFHVERGRCFGLLGPNGSGKTTLFRVLSTLLPTTSGRATIAGMDVQRQYRDVRRRIGVVFQSPSLDPHLTVRENLTHAGHLYGMSGEGLRSRINEELIAMGVDDRATDLVKTLLHNP